MSKRKPAKRARSQKMAARAQRNKQAIVRSPKDNSLRSVAVGSIGSPLKLQEDSNQQDPIVENREAALREAASKAAALPDGDSQMTKDNNSKKGFHFSLVTASMQTYQVKLLEVAQANIKLAFEFSQRLATIRSPFEVFAINAEFTGRWIDTFGKYSRETAAHPFWGTDASRELTALP